MRSTTPKPPARDQLPVALLKLLPVKRRECALYVMLGVTVVVGIAGFYLAPKTTLASGIGAWTVHWLRGLFGR